MTATVSHSPGIRVNGACGPLEVFVLAADEELASIARSYLALYSRRWPRVTRRVNVALVRDVPTSRARGTFLSCAHMTIDRDGDDYLADTQYGFVASGSNSPAGDRWLITVPPDTVFGEPQIGDMEDVFSLICTAGWRAEGHLAVHAGAVNKNASCVLLCASSGGGKSTLTTALVLSGWSTLGDDKLLLRSEGGMPMVRSLLQTFNLDPATGRWFDLGDMDTLPRYSAWTTKRRVLLDSVREGAAVDLARPTHLAAVERNPNIRGIRTGAMSRADTAAALLRQIVLPSDVQVARWTLREAMLCAASVQGVRLEIGDDAYAEPGWLQSLEEVFL